MDHRLDKIIMKVNDYKLCGNCGKINWYENEDCRDCPSSEFKEDGEGILQWCKIEYDFWEQIEGYTEEEADAILLEV